MKKTDSELYTVFAHKLIKNGIMMEPDFREPWFICETYQSIDIVWLEETASKSMGEALEE